jgi:hypothetical protein
VATDTDGGAVVLEELKSIKRLLGLLALKMRATQEEIGIALRLDRSRVSRMLPGIRPGKGS